MNIWNTFYQTGMSPDGQIHLAWSAVVVRDSSQEAD
jgi:hypothetical protein